MKIGTLLTIASLAAAGGGLAVYVAATKYQTMENVSNAQARLGLVRAVGDIPRHLNPQRGFSTNIMYGPAVVDPKARAELDSKYRKLTDGAVDRMNQVTATSVGGLDDGTDVVGKDRRVECPVQGAAHRDRRPGRDTSRCRQEDRGRQCNLQCGRHRFARRAGPQDRRAQR